jgi:hypothetical protein
MRVESTSGTQEVVHFGLRKRAATGKHEFDIGIFKRAATLLDEMTSA